MERMEIVPISKTLEIADEKQITLTINGTAFHVSCTPRDLEELAVGFMISEGLASPADNIDVKVNGNTVHVRLNPCSSLNLNPNPCLTEPMPTPNQTKNLPKVFAEEKFSVEELRNSLTYLETKEYKTTRGYHTAALVGKEGMVTRACDVGRHNAIDKAIGMGVKKGVNFRKVFLLISGRISMGVAMKCVRAGIPLVVSKAAIFNSAIELCMATGLSAVSFATGIMVKGDAIR
jgi:FdhD protein